MCWGRPFTDAMSELELEAVNAFDVGTFVETFGDVYESSPWVAQRAWSDHPFSSVETLHRSMVAAVENASRKRKLTLLRAHPDLGEQAEMTDASRQEQASAGLDQLPPDQYEAFQQLNDEYRNRFDFPFIMAVKGSSPEAIRKSMRERLDNSPDEEFRTALDEVHEIARLRLTDRMAV